MSPLSGADRAGGPRLLRVGAAVAALAAVVAVPGPAQASPTGATGRAEPSGASAVPARAGEPQWRTTGRRALASLGIDPARFGARIELLPGRSGVLGETVLASRTVRLYVREGQSVATTRRVLAHELGHVADRALLTEAERRAWLEVRGATGAPWLPRAGESDFATGAGDFAEVFARWLARNPDFRSRIAPAPSDAELSALAARFFDPLLRDAGGASRGRPAGAVP